MEVGEGRGERLALRVPLPLGEGERGALGEAAAEALRGGETEGGCVGVSVALREALGQGVALEQGEAEGEDDAEGEGVGEPLKLPLCVADAEREGLREALALLLEEGVWG